MSVARWALPCVALAVLTGCRSLPAGLSHAPDNKETTVSVAKTSATSLQFAWPHDLSCDVTQTTEAAYGQFRQTYRLHAVTTPAGHVEIRFHGHKLTRPDGSQVSASTVTWLVERADVVMLPLPDFDVSADGLNVAIHQAEAYDERVAALFGLAHGSDAFRALSMRLSSWAAIDGIANKATSLWSVWVATWLGGKPGGVFPRPPREAAIPISSFATLDWKITESARPASNGGLALSKSQQTYGDRNLATMTKLMAEQGLAGVLTSFSKTLRMRAELAAATGVPRSASIVNTTELTLDGSSQAHKRVDSFEFRCPSAP